MTKSYQLYKRVAAINLRTPARGHLHSTATQTLEEIREDPKLTPISIGCVRYVATSQAKLRHFEFY